MRTVTSTESFQSVLDAARAGAPWAWSRLVESVDMKLRGYVRRLGAADPDNVVGDTWLDVARSMSRFEGDETAFRSWVFMIAHHRVIDERRRVRRKPADLEDHSVLDRLGTPTRSAEDEAVARISDEELVQVLDRLSPAQREVITLRFMAGFGITEIARIVGKKPGAVQALQRRAFRQLEKILGDVG